MHGAGGVGCDFCNVDQFRAEDFFLENDLCVYASHGTSSPAVLPGAGILIPRAHRETPFDLTDQEWLATRTLLADAKAVIDSRLRPDGYNLIWNVGPDAGQEVAHVHLHLLPRFNDEPYAGRGARWLFKQQENRRPDPAAPGLGHAVS